MIIYEVFQMSRKMNGKYLIVFTICFLLFFLSVGNPIIAENMMQEQNRDKQMIIDDSCVESSANETSYYAVIGACSEYIDPSNNIPPFPSEPFPANKLDYIYQALLKSENWDEDNIIFLLNQDATRQNIINALEEMALRVDSNDIFIFSWAGHGSEVLDNDGDEGDIDPSDRYDEVICPHDCERKQGKLVNYISDDELDQLFSNISAKGMCLIFESCLSGGLVDRNISDKDAEKYTSSFTQDVQGGTNGVIDIDDNNRVVLMSSHPDSICRATLTFGFIFTYSVALAMRGLMIDKIDDGFLSAEEIFNSAKYTYIAFSSLQWSFIGILSYIRYKLPGPGGLFGMLFRGFPPAIAALLTVMLIWFIAQSGSVTDGHIVLNYPNIRDNYVGELPLIVR